MNIITRLRRFAAVLTGLGVTMAAFATAASASTGMIPDNGGVDGGAGQAPVPQAVVVSGMPGWQIALIAAALAAAVTAVLLDRMRSARRRLSPSAA
jgi:amino acid transporter